MKATISVKNEVYNSLGASITDTSLITDTCRVFNRLVMGGYLKSATFRFPTTVDDDGRPTNVDIEFETLPGVDE